MKSNQFDKSKSAALEEIAKLFEWDISQLHKEKKCQMFLSQKKTPDLESTEKISVRID